MPNIVQLLPEIDAEEMMYLQNRLKDLSDEQASQFAMMYRPRRRDPQVILLVTLAGFVGIAGIQRFLTDQVGMGILFLLTLGLCFIGTIVDLVNYKKIALDYNRMQAEQILTMIKPNP